LQQTEARVGPRSGHEARLADYERRFRDMVEKVHAGAGQPVTREQVYAVLESLVTRRKPVPVAAIIQHLEQQHPDRPVDARAVNVAVGAFRKRNDFLTEVIETASGPAVRVRRACDVDPVQAATAIESAIPLLEEILDLSGRNTARTSLAQISANAQRVIRALKELRAWADAKQR
jgi:hypothetical protein